MDDQLTPEAQELLENHYGHQVRAMMPAERVASPAVAFAPVASELVDAIEDSAISFGIDPSTVDWATVIPLFITAISSGSWWSLLPLFIKYGPAFIALFKSIAEMFKHKPAPGGPIINPA